MDNMLEQLLTLPNLVFCLMVWVLVWAQRKAVSYVWKKAEENKLYRELLLPMGPIATGGIIGALVPSYPYPDTFSTFAGRVFFGCVCGLASAHVYKILKQWIVKKSGEGDVAAQ